MQPVARRFDQSLQPAAELPAVEPGGAPRAFGCAFKRLGKYTPPSRLTAIRVAVLRSCLEVSMSDHDDEPDDDFDDDDYLEDGGVIPIDDEPVYVELLDQTLALDLCMPATASRIVLSRSVFCT